MSYDSITTILLAEDDETLCIALKKILERAGYSLLIAEDGQQALEIFHEHHDKIDLLVTDVKMPGRTGPELAREFRRSRPDLPVLLISAYPQSVFMLDADWSFLQKPFSIGAILDKVKQVLDGAPSTDTISG